MAPLAIAGCSPAPAADTPALVLTAPAPCAPGGTGPGCPEEVEAPPPLAEAACVNGSPGPRCDGLLDAREHKALDEATPGAQQHVYRTAYRDIGVVVELARLQLRRDADIPDPDGVSDAARSVKNGMRAVAMDDTSVEGRFVLALALARSFQGAPAATDPATRDLAFALVEVALRAVPGAGGAAGAATKALEGYVALELGERARAKEAFEYATALDAQLATAWMGLGDLARGEGQFEDAEAAYGNAATVLPSDPGVRRSVRAAQRREALVLPSPSSAARPAFSPGPIAPAPPSLPVCPASAMAASGTPTLCRGLADLAQATTRDALEAAGRLVIDGWNEALPLCEAKDPACGPHVAEAVAAASRGFQAAGKPSKSIAAAKIVLGRPDVPGVSMVAPALTVEIGDRYHALGIFEQAAEYYARYVRLKAPAAGLAADRALSLFVALRNVDAATKLAGELAMDNQYPDARRAGWLLLVAGLVRAVKGPVEAAAWLDPHRALLAAAGEPGAIAEISKPLPERPVTTTESCPSLLACAIRRLAGEARWSPSAGRIPPLDRSHLKP